VTAILTPATEPVLVVAAEPVTETMSVAEPVSEPAQASLLGETLARESTLLASFERMEIRPFPPPEVGTAVIFTSRIEPLAEPQPELPAEHGFTPPAPPEPAHPDPAPPEPVPLAATEAAEFQPPVEAGSAEAQAEPAQAEPVQAEPVQAAPAAAALTEVAAAIAEAEASVPAVEAPEESKSAEAEFDPTDFLFGPEPEPDPAAFILDPAPPPRAPRTVLPQPEFVATPPQRPQAEEQKAEAQQAAESHPEPPITEEPNPAPASEPGEPAAAPHDPLHALKAMSPNERLAIFS
jgi:hypothetical protein